MTRLAAGCLPLFLLAGCGSDATIMELNFPSPETFFYSSTARVVVYDVTPAEIGLCPTLTRQSLRGTTSRPLVRDTGDVPVCDYRDGGVSFSGISEGPKAFVAVVSAGNRQILMGCTMAEVYDEAPTITIRLYMTNQYEDAVDAIGPLDCGSIEDKCERGCGG